MRNMRREEGFTLVQISIALVVFGLIVGSMLTGRSYEHMGAVRSDISQLEKYQSATESFKQKYNYLPGDIPAALAVQLKLTRRDGAEGRGDGNGLVEGYVYSSNHVMASAQSGEPLFFWEDLFSTDLIKDAFSTATDTELGTDIPVASAGEYLPDAQVGNGNRLYVYSDNKVNYYGLSVVTKIDGTVGTLTSHPGLTTAEAYDIDKKIDDGLPVTGKVLARYVNDGVKEAPSARVSSSDTCYDTITSQYSVSHSKDSNLNCALSFRFE